MMVSLLKKTGARRRSHWGQRGDPAELVPSDAGGGVGGGGGAGGGVAMSRIPSLGGHGVSWAETGEIGTGPEPVVKVGAGSDFCFASEDGFRDIAVAAVVAENEARDSHPP